MAPHVKLLRSGVLSHYSYDCVSPIAISSHHCTKMTPTVYAKPNARRPWPGALTPPREEKASRGDAI